MYVSLQFPFNEIGERATYHILRPLGILLVLGLCPPLELISILVVIFSTAVKTVNHLVAEKRSVPTVDDALGQLKRKPLSQEAGYDARKNDHLVP